MGKIQGTMVHWIFPIAGILPVNCVGWRTVRHPGTIARKPSPASRRAQAAARKPPHAARRALQPGPGTSRPKRQRANVPPETSRPDRISLIHPILRQI
jgi:hypothetical protein